MEILDSERVRSYFPPRRREAHKGDFGKILLLCGSEGYTGAAALAAMGALRTGAGLVYLGTSRCVYPILAGKLLEPVVFPLPDDGKGYGPEAVAEVRRRMNNMDALLIGCGMGQGSGAWEVLKAVLSEFEKPVILDADGINLLSRHIDFLRERTGVTVLTPHAGEFARLTGYFPKDRVREAQAFAREYNCILVLKGAGSVITDGSRVFENPTGNPGMAVGGSGDVLAGMTVSLVGQGIPPLEAAACAAYLHGAAGDLCARELGEYAMLPGDLLSALPRLLK